MIFVVIFINIEMNLLFISEEKKYNIFYKNAVTSSLEASFENIIKEDNGDEKKIDIDEIVEKFYKLLANNLKYDLNADVKNKVKLFIIVMDKKFYVKTPYDSYYKKYSYLYNDIQYEFSLNDTVKINYEGNILEGNYYKLIKKYQFLKIDNFFELKNKIITDLINDEINRVLFSVNKKNKSIKLSYVDSDFSRKIKDFSVFVYIDDEGIFKRFSFSGGRIHKKVY